MINIVPDPTNSNRLTLTITQTLYLDRLLSDVLSDEVSAMVREQARKDMRGNKSAKRLIAMAAQRLLLGMLGAEMLPEVSAQEYIAPVPPVAQQTALESQGSSSLQGQSSLQALMAAK